jgi:hypothetical protein
MGSNVSGWKRRRKKWLVFSEGFTGVSDLGKMSCKMLFNAALYSPTGYKSNDLVRQAANKAASQRFSILPFSQPDKTAQVKSKEDLPASLAIAYGVRLGYRQCLVDVQCRLTEVWKAGSRAAIEKKMVAGGVRLSNWNGCELSRIGNRKKGTVPDSD